MNDEFDEPKKRGDKNSEAPQKIVIPNDSIIEPALPKEEDEPQSSIEVQEDGPNFGEPKEAKRQQASSAVVVPKDEGSTIESSETTSSQQPETKKQSLG